MLHTMHITQHNSSNMVHRQVHRHVQSKVFPAKDMKEDTCMIKLCYVVNNLIVEFSFDVCQDEQSYFLVFCVVRAMYMEL